MWGLSLALHEGTEIESGEVRDRNLNTYTPLRMADVPELDINFIESAEFPMGLGEPPLIAVPPAIGNAVFAAPASVCGTCQFDYRVRVRVRPWVG